jgi:transposase
LLREHEFDDFAEAQCASFYAETMGRPGVPPGIYLRLLLIGYFEGIDSERGIAWRAANSLALRDVLGVALDDAPPDHSTISRTRRLIDVEAHRTVFSCVLQCLSTAGSEHAIDLETGAIVGVCMANSKILRKLAIRHAQVDRVLGQNAIRAATIGFLRSLDPST